MHDKATFIFGTKAEDAFISMVLRRGGIVAPLCAALGNTPGVKAPLVHSSSTRLIAPDTLIIKHGGAVWVEVKAKLQPGYYFNLARWEHGIDWHHAKQYQRVAHESQAPVWLVVYEEHSPQADTAPRWEHRSQAPLPCCVLSGTWLAVSLAEALAQGERRAKWPDGVGGKRGEGGLLWPRSIMRMMQGPRFARPSTIPTIPQPAKGQLLLF